MQRKKLPNERLQLLLERLQCLRYKRGHKANQGQFQDRQVAELHAECLIATLRVRHTQTKELRTTE